MGAITHYMAGGRKAVLTHYASVAEMEEDCLRAPMSRSVNGSNRAALEQSRGARWYGVESLDKVKQILAQGYPEGAALVDTIYDTIAPSLPRAVEYRRKRIRGDQGDDLDIHAVNRGALDKAWTTTRRRAQQGSGLIRITVDICANSYIGAEQLKWRGVAALALSRAMSKAGYSVEIVAGQSGTGAFIGRQLPGTITVTVKPRYTAVDTATLAATVCLPGFFRYLGFASIIRQADDLGVDVEIGLGKAVRLETLLPVPDKIAQVVVPETVSTQERAIAWIQETVAILQGATVAREAA